MRKKKDGQPALDYILSSEFDDPANRTTFLAEMPGQAEYAERLAHSVQPPGMSTELTALCSSPVLTREQEVHQFRKMNYLLHLASTAGPAEASRLRQEAITVQHMLVTCNTRLVVNIVKRMNLDAESFFDAVEEAMIPLMRSVRGFDYSRGFKFSTYCTWAVQRWGYRYRGGVGDGKSFSNMDDGYLETFAENPARNEPIEREALEAARQLKALLRKVDERDRLVIMRRNGLAGESPAGNKVWTLQEIADDIGVSKERIRQVQVRAMRSLRVAAGVVAKPPPKSKGGRPRAGIPDKEKPPTTKPAAPKVTRPKVPARTAAA